MQTIIALGCKSLFVSMLKLFRVFITLMLLAAFLSTQGSAVASDACVDQNISEAQDNIVLSADDDFSVVIKKGKITAVEGNAIRLLPGTHIKRGEELTVSLISQEHYEKLAEEAAEKKREQTVSSILAASDDIPDVTGVLFHYRSMPGQSDPSVVILRQQTSNAVLTDVRTQRSQPAPLIILHKQIPSYHINDQNVASFRPVHDPDYSWGERAECIGVMLA